MKSTATTITALLLAVLFSTSDGFSTSSVLKTPSTTLRMASGKGFGESPPPPPKKKAKQPDPSAALPVTQEDTLEEDEYNPFDKSQFVAPDTSRGKAALDRMRREKAEERNAQLQKMNELQEVDQMMRDTGGEAAVIPEKVAQRMGTRMLPFVGIPLFGSMGAFVYFWYMATYRDMEFQPVLVAGTTIALLAIGLVVRHETKQLHVAICIGWGIVSHLLLSFLLLLCFP